MSERETKQNNPSANSGNGQEAFRPKRIWGIVLEYEPKQCGDVIKLEYNSHSDIVLYHYREQFTTSTLCARDYGLPRFTVIRQMLGKPKSKRSYRKTSCHLTEWRRFSAKYDTTQTDAPASSASPAAPAIPTQPKETE